MTTPYWLYLLYALVYQTSKSWNFKLHTLFTSLFILFL